MHLSMREAVEPWMMCCAGKGRSSLPACARLSAKGIAQPSLAALATAMHMQAA